MQKSRTLTIWDKLQVEQSKKQPVKDKNSTKKNNGMNIIGQIGRWFGLIFWTYVIIHVFFYDFDRFLKSLLPENVAVLVDYKFFIFLLVSALFAIFVKRFYLVYLYIILYPLITIIWSLPLAIYRFRSWVVFLCLMEIISSFFNRLKYKVIMTTITLFCFLLISISYSKPVVISSVFILTLVLLVSLVRTIYMSFKTPVFLQFQSKLIRKFRNAGFIQRMIVIDEKIKNTKTLKLTKEQSTTVLTGIQTALLIHRVIYFWAYQLEKYRMSKISFVISGISYLWLFAKLVIFLSFINYGLFKISPTLFYATSTSFVSFLNYSLNSLFLNETSQLLAVADISILIRFISGFTGCLLLAILILNFIYVAKQTKDDHELSETIKEIKNEGKELKRQIEGEYTISIKEALEKLQQLKANMLSVILLISSQLPTEYED